MAMNFPFPVVVSCLPQPERPNAAVAMSGRTMMS